MSYSRESLAGREGSGGMMLGIMRGQKIVGGGGGGRQVHEDPEENWVVATFQQKWMRGE